MAGFTVASVIDTFNSASGGPPRVVNAMARAGIGRWRSTLITTGYRATPDDTLLIDDFPGNYMLLDRAPRAIWRGVLLGSPPPAVQSAIRALPPRSVLHLQGLWSPLLAAAAWSARAAGIPYVLAPHGMLEPWALRERRLRKQLALLAFQRRVLAHAAVIHATSEAEAEHIRALRLTAAPLHVVPNAIDLPPRLALRTIRQDGPRSLLFLSRVHPKKGLDLLLRLWARLRPAAWRLQIAGDGDPAYVQGLRDFCRVQRLDDVEFLGHVDGEAKERAFAGADAFILPTYSENFGNVIGEAMARGLPVITTSGTPWSCITPLRLGWYVAPDAQGLGRALGELFAADARSLQQMGVRGQQYVRQHLQIESIRPLLATMYAAALSA